MIYQWDPFSSPQICVSLCNFYFRSYSGFIIQKCVFYLTTVRILDFWLDYAYVDRVSLIGIDNIGVLSKARPFLVFLGYLAFKVNLSSEITCKRCQDVCSTMGYCVDVDITRTEV